VEPGKDYVPVSEKATFARIESADGNWFSVSNRNGTLFRDCAKEPLEISVASNPETSQYRVRVCGGGTPADHDGKVKRISPCCPQFQAIHLHFIGGRVLLRKIAQSNLKACGRVIMTAWWRPRNLPCLPRQRSLNCGALALCTFTDTTRVYQKAPSKPLLPDGPKRSCVAERPPQSAVGKP
jgi:hypothetical protein